MTLSIALRIATRTSFGAKRMRQVDRVLDDVDLGLQIRRDVDCGIGDDQRLVVARHVHDEAMADPPRGPQPGVALDHRAHHLVGVQAAFHQRFGPALTNQLDRFGGRIMAVLSIDDLELADVEAVLRTRRRGCAVPGRPGSARSVSAGGRESAFERHLVARVGDRDLYRRDVSAHFATSW